MSVINMIQAGAKSQPRRESEMTRGGTIALDGTKIKANASWHRPMSYERWEDQIEVVYTAETPL